MTRSLAYAVGMDAGNFSMRRGKRTAWNEEDADAAALATNTAMLAAVDVPDFVKDRIRQMAGEG